MISYLVAKNEAASSVLPLSGPELFAEISATFPVRKFTDGVPTAYIDHPSPKTCARYLKRATHWLRSYPPDPAQSLNEYTFNATKAAAVYFFRSKFDGLLLGYLKAKQAYEDAPPDLLIELQKIFRTLKVIEALNFARYSTWCTSIHGAALGQLVVPKGSTSKRRTVVCLPKDFQSILFDATSSDNMNRTVTAISLLTGARSAEIELAVVIRRKSLSCIELSIPCAKDRSPTGRVRTVNFLISDPWSEHLSGYVPQIGDEFTVQKSAKSVSDLGRRLNRFLGMPSDRKFSFYTLRHHFVASLRQQGLHPGEVALLAGHQCLDSQYSYGTTNKHHKSKVIPVLLTAAQKIQANEILSASSQYSYRQGNSANDEGEDLFGDRPGSCC